MQNLARRGRGLPLECSAFLFIYYTLASSSLIFAPFSFHVWLADSKMINIAGVVSIVLFYVLILAVGIWAGRKRERGNDSEEEVMLAGRSIGLFVGIFTMTGQETKIYSPMQFYRTHKSFKYLGQLNIFSSINMH
jgi:hypothetical protein